jgi:tight adherence protein C
LFWLVVFSALSAFFIILIIFHSVGTQSDIRQHRLDLVVEKKKEIYSELDLSLFERFIAPGIKKISAYMSRFRKGRTKKGSAKLEKNLRWAGMRISPYDYALTKNIIMSPFLIAPLLLMISDRIDPLVRLLILVIGLILWVLVPRYFLSSRVSQRQNRIKYQLPEVLDLLSVSIEAGLGFDSALQKIAEKTEGPLIDELTLLAREIQMGKPRRDALRDFGECSMVPEIKTFASALIQADKLGIPIKNLLKNQSEQLRTTRRQAAEEKGMKSPVKMMLPMVAFIFPVLFIILLGPVIVQLVSQFGK